MRTLLATVLLSVTATAQLFPPPAPPLPAINANTVQIGLVALEQPGGANGALAQTLAAFADTADTAFVIPYTTERTIKIGRTFGVATSCSGVLVSPLEWPSFALSFGDAGSESSLQLPWADPLYNLVGIDLSNFLILLPHFEMVNSYPFANVYFVALAVPNDATLVGFELKMQSFRRSLVTGLWIFSGTKRVRISP